MKDYSKNLLKSQGWRILRENFGKISMIGFMSFLTMTLVSFISAKLELESFVSIAFTFFVPALLAPLTMGQLDAFITMTEGEPYEIGNFFQWFGDMAKLTTSVGAVFYMTFLLVLWALAFAAVAVGGLFLGEIFYMVVIIYMVYVLIKKSIVYEFGLIHVIQEKSNGETIAKFKVGVKNAKLYEKELLSLYLSFIPIVVMCQLPQVYYIIAQPQVAVPLWLELASGFATAFLITPIMGICYCLFYKKIQ